jgi:hypothetical protein
MMGIFDWSTGNTASDNDSVNGVSIAEGVLPGNVNNALRGLMRQIRLGSARYVGLHNKHRLFKRLCGCL